MAVARFFSQGLSKKRHVCFLVVTFLYWFSLFIYVPILSPYLESLGASYSYIGIVLGSYGFVQILICLPLGIFTDYIRKHRSFVILSMLIAGLSCFGFAMTNTPGFSLLFRTVAGVSGSIWIIFTVMYSGYFAPSMATKAIGTMQFITVTAQISGLALSGFLVHNWGWHTPFWLGGVAALIGLCLALLLVNPHKNPSDHELQIKDLLDIFREKYLLKVSFLAILIYSILFVTIFGFTPTYALKIGATDRDLSLLVFAFMIPHAASTMLAVNVFVPKFGQWKTLMIGFLGSACFTAVIPFITTFGLLSYHNYSTVLRKDWSSRCWWECRFKP